MGYFGRKFKFKFKFNKIFFLAILAGNSKYLLSWRCPCCGAGWGSCSCRRFPASRLMHNCCFASHPATFHWRGSKLEIYEVVQFVWHEVHIKLSSKVVVSVLTYAKVKVDIQNWSNFWHKKRKLSCFFFLNQSNIFLFFLKKSHTNFGCRIYCVSN